MLTLPFPSQPSAASLPRAFSWSLRAESGGTNRLALAGELDLAERADLESALAEAQRDCARLVLDLEALTLIDCAALAAIADAAERSHDGGALILQSPRGQVRRVLDAVGAPGGVVVLDQEELPARRDAEQVAVSSLGPVARPPARSPAGPR